MKPQKFKQTEIGRIPENWEIKKIEDVAEVKMGQSPPGSSYNLNGNGIKFMQGVRTFGEKYPSFDTYTIQPTKEAKASSVLLSVRAPVGEINITKEDLCIGRGLASLNMKNGNNEFLYYLLKKFKPLIVGRETGSVFGSINNDQIKNLFLPFPDDSEQSSIASILSSLDAKIELNNKMNKTLEAIGQVIFKKWFVDFEFPNENSKSYKSFGGEMIESELGEIPKGWRVGKLREIAEIIGGGTPSTSKKEYYTKSGISWITPKDLSGYNYKFISKGRIDITEKGLQNSSTKIMPTGTIIFSSRAPIGYIAIASKELCTNQGFKSLTPLDKIYSEFLYYFLKKNILQIENLASGSTFKEVSGNVMKNINLILPSKKIIKEFYNFLESGSKKMMNLQVQNKTLSQIRDVLLPKLMSGGVRVK